MKINKMIGALLAMSLCVSLMGVPAFAVDNVDASISEKLVADKLNEVLGDYGNPRIIDVTIPIDTISDSGFVAVLVESYTVSNDQDGLLRGNADKTVTTRFIFNLYDKYDIFCGTAGVGVTGIYSSIDAVSQITDVQVVYEGPYADGRFTYTKYISGNRANVTYRINGNNVLAHNFQISTTGSISYSEA